MSDVTTPDEPGTPRTETATAGSELALAVLGAYTPQQTVDEAEERINVALAELDHRFNQLDLVKVYRQALIETATSLALIAHGVNPVTSEPLHPRAIQPDDPLQPSSYRLAAALVASLSTSRPQDVHDLRSAVRMSTMEAFVALSASQAVEMAKDIVEFLVGTLYVISREDEFGLVGRTLQDLLDEVRPHIDPDLVFGDDSASTWAEEILRTSDPDQNHPTEGDAP